MEVAVPVTTDAVGGARPERPVLDASWFRTVLGQYPTGVCAVTAGHAEHGPVGMTVGSFTSVSLDPPLVAFFPDRKSTSWPKINDTDAFCVNVLGEDQEWICRRLATKDARKMEAIRLRHSDRGTPIIDGALAWIECTVADVRETGDHFMVLANVLDLHIERPTLPLLFFRGGYGRFHPLSRASSDPMGTLAADLRRVDAIRPIMESVTRSLDGSCVATTRAGDEVVVVAAAASGPAEQRDLTLVGTRLPLLPPAGTIFLAWSDRSELESWLAATVAVEERPAVRGAAALIRRRGFSVAMKGTAQRSFVQAIQHLARSPQDPPDVHVTELARELTYDPNELSVGDARGIEQISVPALNARGTVALALTFYGFDEFSAYEALPTLLDVSRRASEILGALDR